MDQTVADMNSSWETMLEVIVLLNFRSVVSQTLRLALGCALLLLLLPAIAFGDEPQKNVLLFNSDDTSLPANVLVNQAIRSALKDSWKSPLQIYDEGQDSFRIPTEDYEAEMVNLLRRKYQRVHLDLIFALGPPVLRFLLKHQNELFSDTPIIFLVTDQSRIADLALGANVTGVSSKVELSPTLELALALHPLTERVVVVGGHASIDKGLLALAQKEFQTYEGRVAFTYLTDLTPEEVRQRLAVLPDKTVVVFLFFNADSAGRTYVSRDVLSQLAPTSRAPIYGSVETHLGHGIVGGQLLSYEALGVAAGRMGLRMLAGESAQSIAPQTVPNVTMVDWRQLRRWGIDEAKLPAGTVVRYKEFSVWELYKWRIIGAITLIVVEALGIVWLLFTQAKRRQAEEARNNLAAIVETSDDAILSNNLEGVITSWNAGAEKIYDYSASEIVGQHVLTLAPADLQNEVAGILGQIRRGESVDHLETMRVSKDGRKIDVSLTVSPIKDEYGMIIGASTIARDITARKKAEAEAVEQRAELAHLSRVTLLGELSGSLAHELNQPLTAILSNAQAAKRFLAHDDVDLDEVRDILTDIVDQDKRAGEVIHRLRLLFKKGEVEQQPLDVNNAVREVLKLIRGDLLNQRVTTLTKLGAALPTVKGDRVQLQQVLLNLVVNACDAMNGNAPPDRQIIVSTELADGARVRFSVSDSGSGLPAGELEQVFEPFFTSKTNGLGLGLSVCRSIITTHGGKLWAFNNPEKGATFQFTLPVNTEVNI